ncbi:MAG: ribonuclease III [Oscillospiraceae bacterium]|jgi:ribonuclease-3|nr:ribonuclease III [Oscillospiraceae bacterium]
MNDASLEGLQTSIGYRYKDISLLKTALTHSSYANELNRQGLFSNERFEFLGDSILGMTVAEQIFKKYPDMPEGTMTRLRADLVCERSLASLAAKLELGSYLLLGRGEEKSGGRARPSILADAIEALLASVYLDGGIENAREFVCAHLMVKIDETKIARADYKTALQEAMQVKPHRNIEYRITGESGPNHMREFTAVVTLNKKQIGIGTGYTKKEAEQNAAKDALSAGAEAAEDEC